MPARAAEPTNSSSGGTLPLAQLLSLANGLEINPQVLTLTDGEGTTVGVRYKYDRQVIQGGLTKQTDIEFRIHSEGLIVAEEEKSPNRLLTHGLRLSAIKLLRTKQIVDDAQLNEMKQLAGTVNSEYFIPWRRALRSARPLREKKSSGTLTEAEANTLKDLEATMTGYVTKGRTLLAKYGTLEPDEDPVQEKWRIRNGGESRDFASYLESLALKDPPIFLSFDLDANAETDQTFTDVQLVGSARLYGKLNFPFLDFPFEMLRGGGPAKNGVNRNRGPYIWTGIALVDASGNDSRKAITADDENFARAEIGVSYRTEVYSTTAANAVALELQWRYYHEFNAPRAIRRADLDNTSYFKATLLFPGNYFLEYTDGKLPLDIEGASTVSVGWRYNF
jgi:hypothetical protein